MQWSGFLWRILVAQPEQNVKNPTRRFEQFEPVLFSSSDLILRVQTGQVGLHVTELLSSDQFQMEDLHQLFLFQQFLHFLVGSNIKT